MWIAMSAAEREEFLADVRVGVLSAAIGTAGQTVAVPVWYNYRMNTAAGCGAACRLRPGSWVFF